MPAVLPVLRLWSKNAQNRCAFDDIMSYWMAHDVITFLVDLERYQTALHNFLTQNEKAQALHFKTVISRQRFVVSRSILKKILLEILSGENIADMVLTRSEGGRILVKDQPHIFISLSYSGSCIAITLGKSKVGSDIERVRPIPDKKIISSPVFNYYLFRNDTERIWQVIHVWTQIESCAKLFDTNPYVFLNTPGLFRNAHFVSYYINHQSIFSLASLQGHVTDLLVWLDE